MRQDIPQRFENQVEIVYLKAEIISDNKANSTMCLSSMTRLNPQQCYYQKVAKKGKAINHLKTKKWDMK